METTKSNTNILTNKNLKTQQSPFLTTPKTKIKNNFSPESITPKSIFSPNVNNNYNSLLNELKDSAYAFTNS